MTIIQAAGRALTVGELREVLDDLDDGDIVMAHGLMVHQVEAYSGLVALDDDDEAEDKAVALGELLEFVQRVTTDRKGFPIRAIRGAAEDLVDEWRHLA